MKNIFIRFIKQNRGVITLEAAVVLLAFVSTTSLIVDLGTAFVQQSKLERATYTAASVLRERIALYADPIVNNRSQRNEPITQEQVDELRQIMHHLVAREDLVLIVEELQFKTTTDSNPTTPEIEPGYPTRFISTGSTSSGCKSTLPNLSEYKSLSPWSARKRWLPLYRVTVCYPGEKSWFKTMVNSSNSDPGLIVEELIAYNIVIPR